METHDTTFEEGELYIVKKGQLMHVKRESDLPKVPLSEAAHDVLLDLRRRCRRSLGGFRPDVALVSSALIEYVAPLLEAEAIVADYYTRVMAEAKAAGQASSLPSVAGSDDAPTSRQMR